jgi:hypothetical protein
VTPAPVASPSPAPTPADTQGPSHRSKKRTPLIIVGIAGAAVFGGLTAVMWAATAIKANDYELHNSSLKDNWSDSLSNTVRSDQDAVKAFNTVAVVSTVATCAFVGVLIAGVTIKHHRSKSEQPSPVSLNLTASGVEVRF